MADWTIIATVAISGASGVFGALAGGYYQYRADRLRSTEDRREAHVQTRQAVFHDFVTYTNLAATPPDMTKPEQVQAYNQTMIEINRAASGALIFGTPAVRDAVYEWLELMNSPDAPEVGSKDSAVIYRNLIEAIRADIEFFRE